MPVYEYACTACGENLEVRQSFTDDALTVCPVCSGRLRKKLSAVGVVFKGSGFYRTDSRASETKEPVKAGADSSGATKSDGASKPASSDSSSSGSGTSGSAGSDSSGSSSGASSSSSTKSDSSGSGSSSSSGKSGSSTGRTAAR